MPEPTDSRHSRPHGPPAEPVPPTPPTPTPGPWEQEYREHIAETQHCLDLSEESDISGHERARWIARAQVHATLAHAAATAGLVDATVTRDLNDADAVWKAIASDWPGGRPDAD